MNIRDWRFCTIMLGFLLLCFSPTLFCQTGETGKIEIKVSPSKTVLPGNFLTQTVRLFNGEDRRVDLEPALNLPEGWKILALPEGIGLAAGEAKTLFLTFGVSDYAVAGDYDIEFAVSEVTAKTIIRQSIKVSVAPCYGVTIALEKPDVLLEIGKKQTIAVNLTNLGNTATRFTLASETDKFQIYGLPCEVALQPGEVKQILFQIEAMENTYYSEEQLHLKVTSPTLSRSAICYQKVTTVHLPESHKPSEYLWNVPANASLRYKGGSSDDGYLGGSFSAGGDFFGEYWFDLDLTASDFGDGFDFYRFDFG